MNEIAVLTPSFKSDAPFFADLHASVLANTATSVVHNVVVPPSDVHLFREYEGPRCRVWTHRDFLPRRCVSIPRASGLTLNVRQPWLPVRGWIVQQIVKMAGTAALDARTVLVIDSDAVLLREATYDRLTQDGRPRHFRRDGGITADMPRHMLWHKVARRLLDVPGTVAAPARDYISPIAVWDPEVVRLLMAHIAATTGRHWIDAVTREPHFSEFIAYGVFVDHVLGGVPAFDGAICHNYYERVPLSGAQAKVFAEQMPTDALGAMISSHSGTADDVRRDVFERCEAVVNGVRPTGAVGARPKVQQRQRAWEPFCLNGLLMLAHLFEFAPAV